MPLAFDANYYINNNADIAAAIRQGKLVATTDLNGDGKIDNADAALQHFNQFGWTEGRNPNAVFNTTYYLQNNPDVNLANVNPLTHYLKFGINETGRAENANMAGISAANFDSATYATNNADLAKAGITTAAQLWNHYIMFGQFETGRGVIQTTAKVAINPTSGSTSANTGTTYTLTTGADSFPGTSLNDTFTGAIVDFATQANSTLKNVDQIAGGLGTDTISIITQGTIAATDVFNGATISGIEIVNVRILSTEVATSTLVATSEMTAVNSDRSVSAAGAAAGYGSLTVTNLATGATMGMIGNGVVVDGAVTFGYKAASDAAVLNVSGGTLAGNVAISSSPTLVTINSTGAANIIGTVNVGGSDTALTVNAATGLTMGAITGAALKTITIAGAAATAATPVTPAANDITSAVQLGALPAAVTTIDASGLTAGGVAVTLIAGITSFKGGAGNDTVTTFNTTSQTASIIDAGAGTGDVLRIGAVTDVNTSTKALTYANFEVIDSMATFTAIDMSLFTTCSFGAVRVGGDGVFTNMTAAQAANVTVYASSSGNYGIANATTSGNLDTLKLTVDDGLPAKAAITLGNITAAGVETINLVATENVTVSSLTGAASMANMTITGGGNVAITTGALATVVNTIVDASGVTGTFGFTAAASTGTNGIKITGSATGVNTITGTANGDTIVGGSGGDTIANQTTSVTATSADTLTGGGGNDTFILRGDTSGAATGYTGASRIADFSVGSTATTAGVSGTDILQLSATAANYGNTAAGGFAIGVAIAAAGSTGVQGVAQSSGTVAYTAGGDLIKLTTGVAAAASVQLTFNAAIGTSLVTGLVATKEIFVSFYDTTASRMVVALADTTLTTSGTLESADTVTLVGTINMTAADYATFSNLNLSIIAS